MQLDECVRLPAADRRGRTRHAAVAAMGRAVAQGLQRLPGRAAFGIVQGGTDPGLRVASAKALADMHFGGIAIGGLAVGEPQDDMLRTIEVVEPYLPQSKPRYLMGVGTPDDLVESVRRGVDMFDCVMPTRAGRHGLAYTRFGKVNLRNARHATDRRPLDEASDCPAARDYSRAYLHHLVKSGEILGMMLLTWVNLSYYQQLMAGDPERHCRSGLGDAIDEDESRVAAAVWAKIEGKACSPNRTLPSSMMRSHLTAVLPPIGSRGSPKGRRPPRRMCGWIVVVPPTTWTACRPGQWRWSLFAVGSLM